MANENKQEPEINFEDFTNITGELDASGNATIKPDIGKVETKPEVEQKLETKPEPVKPAEDKKDDKEILSKDTTTDKEPDKQPDDKVQEKSDEKQEEQETEKLVEEVTKDIRTSKKDFTDIPKEDIPYFSKMSLSAFNRLKPVYLEHKRQAEILKTQEAELTKLRSGALPDSYLEHERAYTLTREFESAAQLYSKAQIVANHWNEQMKRVRAGEQTYQELHQNPQNGDFYLSKPIAVTKETEDEIEPYVKGSEQQLVRVGSAIQTLAASHKSKVDESIKAVKDFEDTSFKHFTGEQGKQMEPTIVDTINKIFPSAFHNNPLVRGYAKALLTIQSLGELVKKQKEQLDSKAANGANGTNGNTDKAKAGPNNSSMVSGVDRKNSGDDITMDDFKEVMGNRR